MGTRPPLFLAMSNWRVRRSIAFASPSDASFDALSPPAAAGVPSHGTAEVTTVAGSAVARSSARRWRHSAAHAHSLHAAAIPQALPAPAPSHPHHMSVLRVSL